MCGHSHLHTDINITWQNGLRVSSNHLFGNKFTVHPELQKIFPSSNSFPLSHENNLTDLLFTFSPPHQHSYAQDVLTVPTVIQAFKQLSCSEAALYASATTNRYKLMKTEHLTLKAFTAGIHMSDFEKCNASLYSQIPPRDSLNVGVKVAPPPQKTHTHPSFADASIQLTFLSI